MKRRAPIRRSRSMRKRIPRRIARMTEEDREYVHWLHGERCAVCAELGVEDCGPIQQAHLRDMTGVGLKEPPMRSIALGRPHHEDYDQAKGRFAGWTRDQRKDWFVTQIAEHNERFLRARYGEAMPL